MKLSPNPVDPLVEKKLDILRPFPPRNPDNARRGREKFLAEARVLKPAVSVSPPQRPKGWISSLKSIFVRKERSPMLATFTSLLLVVSILLGGTGATVYAAQDSLPDQPLYALKTFTEDLRIKLNPDPLNQLNLDLEFVDRRVQEMIAMSLVGESPPDPVLTRLELHLNQAFHHLASLDDEHLPPAAERIQARLQVQEQKLTQANAHAAGPSQAQLTRAQEMIQTRLCLIEEGLQDPLILRERLHDQDQMRLHLGTGTPSGEMYPGPHQTDSGSGYGPGPVASEEPHHNRGYGPGPGIQVTDSPELGDGYSLGPKAGQPSDSGKGDASGANSPEDSGGHKESGPHPTEAMGGHHGPGPQPTDEPGGQNDSAAQETQSMGPGGGHGSRP